MQVGNDKLLFAMAAGDALAKIKLFSSMAKQMNNDQ